MADVELIGFPQSSYVWSARIVLAEKGVAYDLNSTIDVRSREYAEQHHPFNKVPAFHHGEVKLFESLAILHYIDEVFDGPKLVPTDPVVRARMHQWMSVTADYLYDAAIRKLLVPRFVAPGSLSEEAIAANLPTLRRCLEALNGALLSGPWLAGADYSLADSVLTPIVFFLGQVPEGQKALDGLTHLTRFAEQAQARPSFAATLPPLGGQHPVD